MALTSKSPQAVALAALATARRALPPYSHACSPKKFTQHQLFACLVLKSFLKTDYRGVVAHLADSPALVETLELATVPHYTTLAEGGATIAHVRAGATAAGSDGAAAHGPSPAREAIGDRLDRPGVHRGQRLLRPPSRCVGGPWKTVVYHHFPKLGVVCDGDDHFILACRAGRGPRPDVDEFRPLGRRGAAHRAAVATGGRRRLRLGAQSPLRPRRAWRADDHSRQARPPHHQAADRPLPPPDASPVRSRTPTVDARRSKR